jgi:hypothetical protein
MNRVAAFVDAGVGALSDFATRVSGVPLLRIYWYDGTSTGPTAQHLTLCTPMTQPLPR